jgi:hypothetical protein
MVISIGPGCCTEKRPKRKNCGSRETSKETTITIQAKIMVA